MNINDIKFDKDTIFDSFYKTIKNSNILVLKCYKLVFSLIGEINNIGSYIMLSLIFSLIILIIIHIINGYPTLKYYINILYKNFLKKKDDDNKTPKNNKDEVILKQNKNNIEAMKIKEYSENNENNENK